MKKYTFNRSMLFYQLLHKTILIMKLIIVLLTTCLIQVSAATMAQKLTFSKKGASLEQIFNAIESQTGYNVLYSSKQIRSLKKLDVNFNNQDLRDVLEQLADDRNFRYTIDEKNISIKVKEPSFLDRMVAAFAAIDVRGRVVDLETGQGLSGATVKVKGVGKQVSTDPDGRFFIQNVGDDAVLEISYVGYKMKEVKVAKELGEIKLEMSSGELQEVTINKGYYSVSKELNTGNVGVIRAADIAKQPVSDPMMALIGRIPGLYVAQGSGNVGDGLNIQIRGRNSIANGTAPFYIVDGVPYNSKDLSQNPRSSTSSGDFSPFASLRPSDIESIEVLKDADATAIYGSRGANGVILITTKKGKAGKTTTDLSVNYSMARVSRMLDLMNTQQYLEMRKEAISNDNASVTGADFDLNGTWDQNRYTDWQKKIIGGIAKAIDASASISGGSQFTRFLFSGGYRNEGDVLPGNFNNQNGSALLSLTHSSENQKFQMDVSASFQGLRNYSSTEWITRYIFLAPNAPAIYKADGQLNWENNTFQNPYSLLERSSVAKNENLISSMKLTYEIAKGLKIGSSFGYNSRRMDEENLIPFSSYMPNTSDPALNRENLTTFQQVKSWTIEPQVTYNKSFDDHQVDVIVGGTFHQEKQDGSYLLAKGFSSDELIENAALGTSQSRSIIHSLYKYNAIFARLGYTYKKKYLLNVTARRDGSSRFGPGKQFGNFGALGAGWIFSKEDFLKSALPFLSFGKIRGSIGTTGNDQLTPYEYLGAYSTTATSYFGVAGLYPARLENAVYSWETLKKIEFGISLGFLKDRINLDVSVFRDRTGNQLVGYPLPEVTGYPTIQANLPAVVQNKGIELELNTVNVRQRNFSWITSFNLTVPRNKLLSYPNIEGSPYFNVYLVGQPLDIKFMYDYVGVDQNTGIYRFNDKNGDNQISYASDRIPVFIGQKFYGGLNNAFSYKKFNLDVFFQFVNQTGNNFQTNYPGLFTYGTAGVNNQTTAVMDRWTTTAQLSEFQKYTQKTGDVYDAQSLYGESNARITDASFIRLKNVSLSWELPDLWRKKVCLQGARLFLQGQNLLTITRFKGLDPETQRYGVGVNVPTLRVFNIGTTLSF